MEHVRSLQSKADGPVRRNMDFVGSYLPIRVRGFPPPLVANDLDHVRIVGNVGNFEDGVPGRNRNGDKDEGRYDCPGELQGSVPVDLFGHLVVGPPAKLDHRIQQSCFYDNENDRSNPENELVEILNVVCNV